MRFIIKKYLHHRVESLIHRALFSLQFYDNNIVMSLGLVNFRERLQHFLQVAHSFPRVWRDDETHDEFLRGISELGNQVFAGQLDLTRVRTSLLLTPGVCGCIASNVPVPVPVCACSTRCLRHYYPRPQLAWSARLSCTRACEWNSEEPS